MGQPNQTPAAPTPAAPTPADAGVLSKWLKGEAGATLPPPPGNVASGGATTSTPTAEDSEWSPIEIDPSEVQVAWAIGWHPIEIVNAGPYTSNSGNQTLKLTYRCFAGDETGKYRDDYLPISGKGIIKTYRVAESVDLRDKETGKVRIADPRILIGRKLWIEVILKPNTYVNAQGETVTDDRDEIRFPNGYAHITAFQLPQQGDLFAEAGQPIPVEAKSGVVVSEVPVTAVQVTDKTAGAPPSF